MSSERDRARVDALRASVDAVMVGGRTLLQEDPRLTVRSAELRAERAARGEPENPAKVGVVSRPDLRPDCRFLSVGPARIVLFTSAPESESGWLRDRHVEVHTSGDSRVDLAWALEKLADLGIRRLLVEGGGTLNFELLRLGLVDGVLVSACLLPAVMLDGASITTVEGLAPDEEHLSPLQEAFIRHGGFQCGICTPGQLIAATALLEETPRPTEAQVQAWMMGNLCRCTGYYQIVESVLAAAAAAS